MLRISDSALDSQGSPALPKGNTGCMSSPSACFISHLMTNESSLDLQAASILSKRGGWKKYCPVLLHPVRKQKNICALLLALNSAETSLLSTELGSPRSVFLHPNHVCYLEAAFCAEASWGRMLLWAKLRRQAQAKSISLLLSSGASGSSLQLSRVHSGLCWLANHLVRCGTEVQINSTVQTRCRVAEVSVIPELLWGENHAS